MLLNLDFQRGHIPALDGVRGLAIALVLAYHCFLYDPLYYFSGIGWAGVDLFFVLSGFLITGILLDTKSEKNFIRNFMMKRALRIFPLYYLSLGAFFILNARYSFADPIIQTWQIYFWTYTQNYFFVFYGWYSGSVDVLNHFWSLAQEEQFYLIWPALVYFSSKSRLILISVLGIAISLILRNLKPESTFAYIFFFSRMDALLIGCLCAILIRENKFILNKITLPVSIISATVVLVSLLNTLDYSPISPFFSRSGYTLLGLFFAGLIVVNFDQGRVGLAARMFFGNRFLRMLGKYSYGIYVYHWILYKTIYPNYFESIVISGNQNIDKTINTLLFLVLVLIVSNLSYHFFEKFFLNLKTKLS